LNTEIKIGIVDDELLIAEKTRTFLMKAGYEVCEPVPTYAEALLMIDEERPDILLLDINLNDKKDGIDLAEKINEKFRIPFIFLTAYGDKATIDRAKKVRPNAYLIKPFNKDELFAAVALAVENFISTPIENVAEKVARDFIFVKDAHRFVKLLFKDVLYIESEENYVHVHTIDKKSHLVRSTFSEFLNQLPSDDFFRCHRSFAVCLSAIEHVEPTEVLAGGFRVPISATYRPELLRLLGIKE
jgi:DNA-binding LytR/AlgR family response regulator